MPPTLAAARNTACGRLAANHLLTAAWSRRSTSERVIVWSSTFSRASRRVSAAPTMPRWPATKTVLPFSSNGVPAIGNLPLCNRQIARHHLFDKLGERRLRLPAELLVRFAGMAPVALGFEIAEKDRFLKPGLDARHAARDLARHKSLAADRAFMVEQDAVGGEHAVGLAVVHRDPVAVEFCHRIGRARIERRG